MSDKFDSVSASLRRNASGILSKAKVVEQNVFASTESVRAGDNFENLFCDFEIVASNSSFVSPSNRMRLP